MIKLLSDLVPEEGVRENVIDNVNLFRITSASPRLPQTYDPGIIILAQGHKKIFVGDEEFIYDPLHYLVLSVPLPLECETFASTEKPLLGIKIKVEPALISEILMTVDESSADLKEIPAGVFSAPLDEHITDAAIRLLESLASSSDTRFLGPMIVKEIIYRVICGENGNALRALAYRNQKFFKISRILNKIHKDYGKKLDLNSLAIESGMSISTFHASFKSVTNVSPLQYIKNIRLHKARLLMIEEGINAYSASIHVGYESPSQFNREYKRLFGISPGKDALKTDIQHTPTNTI
jgi:AraC-like DNA-binding protein